jgi:hypothetical protein
MKTSKLKFLLRFILISHILILIVLSFPHEFIINKSFGPIYKFISPIYAKLGIHPGVEVFKGAYIKNYFSDFCLTIHAKQLDNSFSTVYSFPKSCIPSTYRSELSYYDRIHLLPIFFNTNINNQKPDEFLSSVRANPDLEVILEYYCKRAISTEVRVKFKLINSYNSSVQNFNEVVKSISCTTGFKTVKDFRGTFEFK